MADAGRVIAGSARGMRLAAPGAGTRPLADRVKQTLFAILEPDLPGARVLDLFAGSGAAGIEALSRGAESAAFVEKDAGACRAIELNLVATSLAGPSAAVVRREAAAFLRSAAERTSGRAPAGPPWDVVIVDPPYADRPAREAALALLGDPAGGLLAPGARVVATHFWRDVPAARFGLLASERERRFGESALTFYRREEGT